MARQIFNGYVELNEEAGILAVTILDAGSYTMDPPIPAFGVASQRTSNGYEIITAAQFRDFYGLKLYNTLEDFKRGDSISIDKVMV